MKRATARAVTGLSEATHDPSSPPVSFRPGARAATAPGTAGRGSHIFAGTCEGRVVARGCASCRAPARQQLRSTHTKREDRAHEQPRKHDSPKLRDEHRTTARQRPHRHPLPIRQGGRCPSGRSIDAMAEREPPREGRQVTGSSDAARLRHLCHTIRAVAVPGTPLPARPLPTRTLPTAAGPRARQLHLPALRVPAARRTRHPPRPHPTPEPRRQQRHLARRQRQSHLPAMQRGQAEVTRGAPHITGSTRYPTIAVMWVERRVSDPCFCNPTWEPWRAV